MASIHAFMDRRVIAILASTALLAVVVGIVLIARGGDGDSSSSSDPVDLDTKPEVGIPDEPPPDELVVEDIVEGGGPAAKSGDRLAVQYVGVNYETGEEFDSSWENPEPLEFELGAGDVIQGWDQGIEGMTVGSRRKLTIPPDLAYGPEGAPPDIGPDATLVFVVDLVEIK